MLTVTGSDGTDDERVIVFPLGVKTPAANPRICVKSPDFGVVVGATVLGGAADIGGAADMGGASDISGAAVIGGAAVVAQVDVEKSLAGVNTLLI
jgi:hypothetical protein